MIVDYTCPCGKTTSKLNLAGNAFVSLVKKHTILIPPPTEIECPDDLKHIFQSKKKIYFKK